MRSERIALGFDCSGPWLSIALVGAQSGFIAGHSEELKNGQAERLIPEIEALLLSTGLGYSELGAIGVGIGPGNFTGLRIAVAAARGIALASHIPTRGVSGFEIIRYANKPSGIAAIEAPREQFYTLDLRDKAAQAELSSKEALNAYQAKIYFLPPIAELAHHIAAIALSFSELEEPARPSPLYIRPPDAAPAAKGPAILAN